MKLNVVGAFIRNAPFGTEIAFAKGLRLIGVEVNEIDPSYDNQVFDKDADATLLFKWIDAGKYREELKACKGPKIVYQPDDYRFSHIKSMMKEMRNVCDFALTYDDEAAKNIKNDFQYKLTKKMLLTADPTLYRQLLLKQRDVDFCFIGSLTGGTNHASRAKMLQILKSEGFKVLYATNVYDIEKIVEIYNRSKVVLNHATDIGQPFGKGWGLQCRHFEVGFTGTCLLSNVVYGGSEINNIFTFENEKQLIKVAKFLLDNPHYTNVSGIALKAELDLAHKPEHRAREILNFISECNKCA